MKKHSGIQTHNIEIDDISEEEICDNDILLDMYNKMYTLRYMEILMDRQYKLGKIRGFCHLTIGQENIYTALNYILSGDKVIGSYRCHSLAYITGCTIKEIFGELLGKKCGNCKGKGGSMHLYNENFFGGHGIVGAQVPLGVGIAYALKYKAEIKKIENKNVCFAFYGDGASNQGQIYESFNMAKIWNIPIVFVCENNKYGMWTPVEVVSVDDNFFKRGYGIPGIRVSDKDVFILMKILRFAKKYALENGPIIVQIDTYRTCGHSTIDTADFYRDKHEVDIEKGKDCIYVFEDFLKEKLKDFDIGKVRSLIEKDIDDILDEVLNSPDPEADELYKDLLCE